MFQNIITLDFETYFSNDYSLTRLTTEAYVRDPRFQTLLVAVKVNHAPTEWYTDAQFRALTIDWSRAAVVAHHAQFDGLILSHVYGIRPRFIFDTLSMARLVIGNHLSVSLASLADYFGLAGKSVPYNLFKGRTWDELPAATQHQLGDGACHDVDLTYRIFRRLAATFPLEEYAVIDATVRMFTEPTLVGDTAVLAKVWRDENERKADDLAELGCTAGDLQSTDRFRVLLEDEGVEIELKDGKNGEIPAFAKSDEFMKGLLDHENPRVRALAAGRLGLKSTLLQTRAATLGHMACRGPLTVYLRYCGAHTTRWSGGDSSNLQNLRRGSALRTAICAPPGFQLAVIDLSQIECRLLAYVADQDDLVDRFRRKEDPYLHVASAFYGREIKKEDKQERLVGKVLELQSGYGSGAAKIRATLRNAGVMLTEEEGEAAKTAYRSTHPHVVAYWRTASIMLDHLTSRRTVDWGCMQLEDGRIYLPNDCPLIYDDLKWTPDGWQLKTRHGWVRMYGAKLVENVVQALARVVLSQAMLRITATGLRIVGCAHDEIWVLIPNRDVDTAFAFCMAEMKRSPAWLPEIPLDAEGHVGDRYTK